MSTCQVCHIELPSDGAVAECGTCKAELHFQCSSISEDSWRTMSYRKKAAWKCPECRTNKPLLRRNNSNVSLVSEISEDNKDEAISYTAFEKLISSKFKEMNVNMDKRFKEYENSLEFQSDTIKDLNNTLKQMQRKIISLESGQEKLEKQNEELRTKIKLLERNFYQNEQDGNKCKLEITGMPPNENQETFVKRVFTKVGVMSLVENTGYKIEKLGRPGNSNQPKGLVVTLKDQQTRDAVLEKVRKDKPSVKSNEICTHNGPANNIYINEHLSAYLKKVYYEAKQLKKDKKYEYLWVRNGHILLKKNQQSNTIRLACLEDIKLL